MHLGNVFSALLAWLSVRSRGGRMILRMEDLDPDRCREEYALQLADDLLQPLEPGLKAPFFRHASAPFRRAAPHGP